MAFKLKDVAAAHGPVPTTVVAAPVEDPVETWLCPTGKIPYASKAKARQASRLANTVQRNAMHSYRCDLCDHYHLGHRRGQI